MRLICTVFVCFEDVTQLQVHKAPSTDTNFRTSEICDADLGQLVRHYMWYVVFRWSRQHLRDVLYQFCTSALCCAISGTHISSCSMRSVTTETLTWAPVWCTAGSRECSCRSQSASDVASAPPRPPPAAASTGASGLSCPYDSWLYCKQTQSN